ncbi:hypothetical protein JHL17_10900 [Azospirillum sp. YIM B02556]|uniref:Uncharacterized protein n=1 Tax=Azospirillum endophyticum TaxID=2800326 RepID=A0ABS1F3D4_9PROT|nr:hypothetical protein [Azospirillum endophyticum]MBK1837922.1 hypothetical protein [Azospirillum endophyticum]
MKSGLLIFVSSLTNQQSGFIWKAIYISEVASFCLLRLCSFCHFSQNLQVLRYRMKFKPEVSTLRKIGPNKKLNLFDKITEKVNNTASLATNIVKLSVVASTVFGGPLISLYLSSVGAPFPASDSGTAIMLIVFMMMLASGLTLITFWLALPALSKFLASASTRTHFQGLFRDPNNGKGSLKEFLSSYILLYYPMFLLLITAPFSFLESGTVEAFFNIFIVLSISTTIEIVRFKARGRTDVSDVIMFKLFSNLFSLFWIYFFVMYLFSTYDDFGVFLNKLDIPEYIKISVLLSLTFLTTTISHVGLSRWGTSPKLIFLLFCFCIFLLLSHSPGAISLTSTSLRNLGFGGGVPVTIMVKRFQENNKDIKPELLSGCLILQTSTTVMIKAEKIPGNCVTRKSLTEPTVFSVSYKGIIVFQRSDVTEIKEFTAMTEGKR